MRVLVACEESQTVCKAFRALGHEAYSCDLQACSGGHPEWHIQGDALYVAESQQWDMMLAFPPCTYLSSVQTFLCRRDIHRVLRRLDAARFFIDLLMMPIDKIAIENPTGVMSHIYREPDQIVHPYFFGADVMKRTGLWLKNLPKLIHADTDTLFEIATHGTVPPPVKTWIQKSTGKVKYQRQVNAPFLDAKTRSKLNEHLAKAMAEQWGGILKPKCITP